MKERMSKHGGNTYINTLLEQANAGDAEATSRLADCYRSGHMVDQNWEQAFRWYSVAARAGDMEAQNNLGTLYLEGYYCPEDHEKAVYWYRKSAEQGAKVAQYNLGMRYIHGQGVPVDNLQAMTWLEKSSENGYPLASYDLGLMYLHGEGCKPDRSNALRLMMAAASDGDERAVETLISKVPELEELALEGDVRDWLRLSDLFYDCFKLPNSKAYGWAWLLWADAHFVGHASFDAGVFGRLQEIIFDKDKRGGTSVADKKKGEKLFNAMQHERAIAKPEKSPTGIADSVPAIESDEEHEPVRLPDQWREACSPDVPTKKRLSKTRPGFELILDLAAEGGGVDLYGKPARDGSWTFWSDMNDWTPTMEDEDAIHRTTTDVSTWNAAVAVLDEHFPYWTSIHLCYVHPNFRKRILELIEDRQAVKQPVRRKRGEK
jgi:hypothetical protein